MSSTPPVAIGKSKDLTMVKLLPEIFGYTIEHI